MESANEKSIFSRLQAAEFDRFQRCLKSGSGREFKTFFARPLFPLDGRDESLFAL
jgi:hypothetical protein